MTAQEIRNALMTEAFHQMGQAAEVMKHNEDLEDRIEAHKRHANAEMLADLAAGASDYELKRLRYILAGA